MIPNAFTFAIILYVLVLFFIIISKDFVNEEKKETLDHLHQQTNASEKGTVSPSPSLSNKTKKSNMKYILQWTDPHMPPFDLLDRDQNAFVKNNCLYRNCYVTEDEHFLDDITDFDAVIFNGKDAVRLKESQLPQRRSSNQKYVFAAMESAHYYPVCRDIFEDYFNWTWTYRLDSDFRWGYITVYDLNGTVVGPSENMHWVDLKPINDSVKKKLASKSKTVAWFISNCGGRNDRMQFAEKVYKALSKYDLMVDTFGACGSNKCPKKNSMLCFKMLQKYYYFYFSFENSFAEDYVTEKLLNALNNYVVPVVYGGANYSRFLPPGSYLNGRELGPEKLAETMNDIINNSTRYHDFFRWRNHYKYKETSAEDVCKLCEWLNNEEKMKETSIHHNFRKWWNIDDKICSYYYKRYPHLGYG